jgi:predicted aspartyl protease
MNRLKRLAIGNMANAAKKIALSLLFVTFTLSAAALPAAADEDPGTILPVRTLRGYLMVVPVFVNDHGPFDFLLDTGTNTTLIDPALAAELGLKAEEKWQLVSLAGSTNVSRYYLQTFRMGPGAVSNLEALAVRLPLLTAADKKIRGIVGMNFLLHFSFRLDYKHKAVELYPFPEAARVPEGIRIPVEINASRLLIKVASHAAPLGSWKLVLDSGSQQFLVFQKRITSQGAGLGSCGQPRCLVQVSTNLADHSASIVYVHDVSIEEVRLPGLQVVVMRNDLQAAASPQDGLFPAAPFHSIFFDRTNATLIFSPSPRAMSRVAVGVE